MHRPRRTLATLPAGRVSVWTTRAKGGAWRAVNAAIGAVLRARRWRPSAR